MVTWSDDAKAAWELYAAELTRLPGVVSVSTGTRVRGDKKTREQTVVVTVLRKVAPSALTPSTMVPRELLLPDGSVVRTDVVEDPTGVYTPDQDSAPYRPVPGGCEIGPFGSAFLGTLGGWFCSPAPEGGSGWNPVWLTNAHVADPINFSTVPADPRMTQPWGGGVIGNTTVISGWPNPLPGPFTVVGGVTDAAIGVLADDVDPDYQVRQIGPAPFEIGTVTGGTGVQKRGRTTLLRTGTVQTQSGGGTFLSTNVNSGAGGQVTFGLPGQPRLYRIVSPGPGLGVAFGLPGDSGSLVFGTARGRLQSTFPCVGLYFAGNGRWVTQQTDPSVWTVTGLAFDIVDVMTQLNLETVCSCVVRSLLAAIFGQSSERASTARTAAADRVSRSEAVMRRFRNRVLAKSSVGKIITAAVAETAPEVSRVLALDPIAFGLAVQFLEPWANEATSLSVLQRTLDSESVTAATGLAERVIRQAPDTEERIRPLIELVQEYEGQPIRKLIGRYRPSPVPKAEWNEKN